jgi:transposase
VADCVAADTLLERMPATSILLGDKGYDSDAVRRKIEDMGAAPNIPPKINRRWKSCFSPVLYRDRNAIERMFGRIKSLPPRKRGTSAGSRHATTRSPETSSQPFVSSLPSATGYESGA